MVPSITSSDMSGLATALMRFISSSRSRSSLWRPAVSMMMASLESPKCASPSRTISAESACDSLPYTSVLAFSHMVLSWTNAPGR